MIRVDRGAEPRGLRRSRANRLGAAIASYDLVGNVDSALTDGGYNTRATRLALFLAQHKKCAWCERYTDFSGSPVEHYRPRNGAWRNEPGQPLVVDTERYWWLTWSWENLLFACTRCNNPTQKGNYFPLQPTTAALPQPPRPIGAYTSSLFDTTAESPLLLDPADPTVKPLDHIEWRPAQQALPKRLWTWTAVHRSERGRVTIKVLGLDRLADSVQDYILKAVLPSVEEVEKHIAAGRRVDAIDRWNTLLSTLFDPKAELTAATWCALQFLVPPAYRAAHGLMDPPRP